MSNQSTFDLHTFFPYRVRMFYKTVSQSIKKIYTEQFGLNVHEWRTMANLHNFRPLSAKEIVECSSIGKVNVSRAIASLQKKDLLERHIDPTDRRRVLLCLTPKGKKIMNELIPLLREKEQELLSSLTPDEAETLCKLMLKVRNTIGTADGNDPELDD